MQSTDSSLDSASYCYKPMVLLGKATAYFASDPLPLVLRQADAVSP